MGARWLSGRVLDSGSKTDFSHVSNIYLLSHWIINLFYFLFSLMHYSKRTAHLAAVASLPCDPLKHIHIYTNTIHILVNIKYAAIFDYFIIVTLMYFIQKQSVKRNSIRVLLKRLTSPVTRIIMR